ncbi:hypothetical protein KKH18_07240 [bacterium]|nr:hypothetical protein [bacterium]
MIKKALFLVALLCAVSAFSGDLYLNIIWHQHQPLYVNPETDQLSGPWVRTHATKDYYDMAAMHKDFPEVHATINLTSSLLYQLEAYYLKRLAPDNLSEYIPGHTDPWIDLALNPAAQFTPEDIDLLVNNPWNALAMSQVQMNRFPEYAALRDKPRDELTDEDYAAILCWFYLANFDPDFLRGTSDLNVDLTDLLREENGLFYLKKPLTRETAVELVQKSVEVMRNVIPVHRQLMESGKLELITTPFYHPILPLLIDSDIAKVCQPNDELPPRFAYPADANAQVVKGIDYYQQTFGSMPNGMWPAEGSISEDAAAIFAANNIQWICGDMHVLERSLPSGLDIAEPYRLSTPDGDIMIVFRETYLSDHIGFTYQNMQPQEAADHFLGEVLHYKPAADEPDRLLTVILDGENAWEWYEYDMDGKQFLKAMYQNLTDARASGDVTCVTPSEYINGNPDRNIPAHPVSEMTAIEKLWPGSWISANYNTWIGEKEENKAWEYLLKARQDLESTGFPQPDPRSTEPANEPDKSIWQAYESIYAAEGSDWFWWYGADQTAGTGDRPFEEAFFQHLRAVYRHANDAGANLTVPEFAPILSAAKVGLQENTGGAMARSTVMRTVRFTCDATEQIVPVAIFIAGNEPSLSEWNPNTVRLYDDGTHGDQADADGIWSLELDFPVGSEIQYKYTNSGAPGDWQDCEEFPQSNRAFTVEDGESVQVEHSVFGIRD